MIVGGYNETGPLAEIWIYDLARSMWQEIMGGLANKGPLPRVDFDACILGNKVYLFGGMETDETGDQALIYNDLWSFDLDSRRWVLLNEESPVSERMGHVCVSIDSDHFILHGGDCLGKAFSDLWLYTASSASWQRVHDNVSVDERHAVTINAPCARSNHSACLVPEVRKVALFAGMAPLDGQPSHMNDFWLLDTSAGSASAAMWSWSRIEGSSSTTDPATAQQALQQAQEENGVGIVFPSPSDMPAIASVPTAAGPKLVVLGGFGLQEVDSEDGAEDEEEDRMQGIEAEGGGDGSIAVGYLADVWTIDMAGTCTELGDDEINFISGSGAPVLPSWGSGGFKRGAKLVGTSQGLISFGGFDGDLFCGALEKVELKLA